MEVEKASFTPDEYRVKIRAIATQRRDEIEELVKKNEMTIDEYNAASITIDFVLLLTNIALEVHTSLPLLRSISWMILQLSNLFFSDTRGFDNLSKAMATLLEMIMNDMVSGDEHELCVKRGKKIIHQGNNIKH